MAGQSRTPLLVAIAVVLLLVGVLVWSVPRMTPSDGDRPGGYRDPGGGMIQPGPRELFPMPEWGSGSPSPKPGIVPEPGHPTPGHGPLDLAGYFADSRLGA